eukprot:TRINITY_DN17352_c0_g1_i1.p1 TRINITY_DN17352_c0_g1~~TRINITY_DN17352_c0_g1_i1.p1  ORF type:complete len:157 (+),score=27.30 TRINITY_DN17352_c0_g1_i1:354-824(+)
MSPSPSPPLSRSPSPHSLSPSPSPPPPDDQTNDSTDPDFQPPRRISSSHRPRHRVSYPDSPTIGRATSIDSISTLDDLTPSSSSDPNHSTTTTSNNYSNQGSGSASGSGSGGGSYPAPPPRPPPPKPENPLTPSARSHRRLRVVGTPVPSTPNKDN